MKLEDKELLLNDLSARLPHGVMLSITYNKYTDETFNASISAIDYCGEIKVRYGFEEYEQVFSLERVKPYLFPLSSMTEEQKKEQEAHFTCIKHDMSFSICKYMEWCYKNHLDVNGLIPKGLAIDATGLNIY